MVTEAWIAWPRQDRSIVAAEGELILAGLDRCVHRNRSRRVRQCHRSALSESRLCGSGRALAPGLPRMISWQAPVCAVVDTCT